MHNRTLTQLLLSYRESGDGWQVLLDQSALFIFDLARRKRDWDEDDVSDFLCFFLPKLPDLIRRFDYCGKPFEAYLLAHLKWSQRSFSVRLKQRRTLECVYCREELWELHEENPEYLGEGGELPRCLMLSHGGEEESISPIWKQRLILLCLRECERMDHRLLEHIAAALQVERLWLIERIQEARAGLEAARMRLEREIEARNTVYVKLQLLQHELQICTEPYRRAELERKLQAEREMLAKRNRRIARQQLRPTNREIAALLDMPKGSVDSGIFYLQRRLPGLLDKEDAA